jgi:hypothetical protein
VIRIDRATVEVPNSLSANDGAAAVELQAARAYFAKKNGSGPFKFMAYKSPDIAEALQKLFLGKCAYCESRFAAVSPLDVEHFRPKGRVTECKDHPGYWWLAAQWDNLLASCIDCNRRRYHYAVSIESDPLVGGRGGKFLTGKQDCFPIFGAGYAREEGDNLEAEDPALIDPTRRNPSEHLVWLEQQELSLVGPRLHEGRLDPYGKATYRVFGLNRQRLVEERTARMREVKAQIINIEESLDLAVTLPDPGSGELMELSFKQYDELWKYAEPDQPYSAAIANLLARESERLTQKYSRLQRTSSLTGALTLASS